MSKNDFHPLSWQVILSGLIVTVLGGLILTYLIYIQTTDVLFSENFEDNKAQRFIDPNPDWKITGDENNQKVYELNNTRGDGYPGFTFGNTEWTDFTITFRLRIFEKAGNVLVLHFRENEWHENGYVLGLQADLNWVTLAYKAKHSEWNPLNVEYFNYDRNVWYEVRVVANGDALSAYIDDFLVGKIRDSRIRAGRFSLSAGPGTHIQIDDILVKEIR